MKVFAIAIAVTIISLPSLAFKGGRNPYNIPEHELDKYVRSGRLHTLNYPVTVTGSLLPYDAFKNALNDDPANPLKKFLQKVAKEISGIHSFVHLQEWLGLHPYPLDQGEGPYQVPFEKNIRPDDYMGFSLLNRHNEVGFSFSCATCHSANLFGRQIIGLSNRFPRANHLFVKAKQAVKLLGPKEFKAFTGARSGEVQMYRETRDNLESVEAKKPAQLGLDTSLAQVALSLSRRNKDGDASKNRRFELLPRRDILRHRVADSKPATWWTLKYKTRWLLDGSVVSGNPILTNILWNEIGRGTELPLVDQWLKDNEEKIKELTTAVFSAEPPPITDFFPATWIDIEKAKRGEKLFNNSCAKCHGYYEKNWSYYSKKDLSISELIKNYKVKYPQPTKVKDVGTDPRRYKGMTSLLQLNELNISKNHGIVIEEQKGYVPPPLVGIWARWPYFHNNSIPNLCALLTPEDQRPKKFFTGEAIDPQQDFDYDCNGYPTGQSTPEHWKNKEFLFDTSKKGLSNLGHSRMLIDKNTGKEVFSAADKTALINYLKTL